MLAGYVYLVTNKLNGKQYVGCTTTTVENRWKKHVRESRTDSHRAICRAIRKYGSENFEVTCLEGVEGTHHDLMCAEVRLVKKYACLVPSGYNMTEGGAGVDLSVPEVRERYTRSLSRYYSNPEWRRRASERAKAICSTSEWKESPTRKG